MPREQRNFSVTEKMAILREHLIEKVPISEVCEKYGLQPTVIYGWQKKLFEEGAVVFEHPQAKSGRQAAAEQRKIEALEARIRNKDEVLAELLGEHVALKKVLGRSEGGPGSPRRAGRGGGLRESLVGPDGGRGGSDDGLAGRGIEQVLRLAQPVREGQRAQRLGAAGSLAGAVGEGGDYGHKSLKNGSGGRLRCVHPLAPRCRHCARPSFSPGEPWFQRALACRRSSLR